MFVDLPRGAQVLDGAVVHHGDAVRHRQRLILIVRHVDERDADLALDALELDLHRLAQLEVQRPERLVEQQGPRSVDQRAGHRDPLLLATRQFPRPAPLPTGEVHDLEHLPNPAPDLRTGHALALESERDILVDVHVREECVRLEHHVHVAPVRWHAGDVDAAEVDRPGRGLLEAGDHPHRRRLAAAGRAEHREELALPDGQVDAGDRGDDLPVRVVLLGDTREFDGHLLGARGEAGSRSGGRSGHRVSPLMRRCNSSHA